MTSALLLLILLSAFLHAGWNALVKSARIDALSAMSLVCLAGAFFSLPFLLITGLPNVEAYPYLLTSGFVHIAYYLLVGFCYRHGDYSAVYPIFRGGAPLLTVMGGSFFLNEWLAIHVYFGVFILVSGLFLLSFNALKQGGISMRPLIYALILACVVALYSLVDGVGSRLTTVPYSYVLATHLVNALFMLPVIIFYIKPDIKVILPVVWVKIAIAGGLSVIAYGIVLYAMTQAPIGIVSALRETSVLFAAIIGALFLGEKLGSWHFFAALLIVIGLIVIKI